LPRRASWQGLKSASLLGKYDRSNLMIETEKQTDCHVVPPRNDASESHYEERGTK
jgi:hypothetical protein